MAVQIPFSKVECNGKELEYIREVLSSGWLTTAGKTHALEDRFRKRIGSRFAYAVNSCTAGLHLGLEALGVGPCDKVLVPTMTFTASAEVIRYLGADPIFIDVEYGSSLVTRHILSKAIELHPDAKVFIPVHFGGQAAPLLSENGGSLLDLCQNHNIRILEDAAHAFPTYCLDKMIGNVGDVTCFSFYANKTITTGEGGMVTTNDPALSNWIKVMRLHGIDRDVWDRFTSDKPSWEYDVIAPGYKYNMPDTAAAIGLAQLEKADFFRKERERCARFYMKRLAGLDGIDLPLVHCKMEDHAWHLFVIILNDQSPISRNRFIEILAKRGIGTSVHYKPLHRMTYYRERYDLHPEDFPNAEKIWKGCVSLPIYPSLTNEELEYVCEVIWEILS